MENKIIYYCWDCNDSVKLGNHKWLCTSGEINDELAEAGLVNRAMRSKTIGKTLISLQLAVARRDVKLISVLTVLLEKMGYFNES